MAGSASQWAVCRGRSERGHPPTGEAVGGAPGRRRLGATFLHSFKHRALVAVRQKQCQVDYDSFTSYKLIINSLERDWPDLREPPWSDKVCQRARPACGTSSEARTLQLARPQAQCLTPVTIYLSRLCASCSLLLILVKSALFLAAAAFPWRFH